MTKRQTSGLIALVQSSTFLVLIGGCSVHGHELTPSDGNVGDAAGGGHETSSSEDGSAGREGGGNDDRSVAQDGATYDAAGGANDAAPDSPVADADASSQVGDDIWAVGETTSPLKAVVIHWTQQTKWEMQSIPALANYLYDVWGTDRSNVWAVGNGGIILHYDGARWMSVTSPTAEGLGALWGSSRSDVWAVGYDLTQKRGLIVRFDGNSWSLQSSASIFDNVIFSAIWGTGPRDIWIAGRLEDGSAGKLLHLNAVGHWEDKTPAAGAGDSLSGVWLSTSTSGWAVGSGGVIMQLSGSTWTPLNPSATMSNLKAVSGLSGSEVWALGWFNLDLNTQILRYNGAQWAAVPLGPDEQNTLMNDVFIRSARDVWFAGFSGVVLHYDGMNVTADPTVPTHAIMSGIWGPR